MGIVVSTAALFVILSVFGGLKQYSLSFSNSTDPDLMLTPKTGKSFVINATQEKQLKAINEIKVYSKVAEERVLFYFNGKEHVASLKGTDSLFTGVSQMKKQLVYGQWPETGTAQVVVGVGTTNKLSLGLSDFNHALEVYVPKAGKGLIESPDDAFNKSDLVPVGVYSVNDDVDSKYVYCDLDLAQRLLQFAPNQVSSLEIKLDKPVSEESVKAKLQSIFNNTLIIKNRAQLNDSLYKMLNAENLVTYLFCSLVVVMTLFCLAGALIMLILDKRENIKTLYNLGAPVKNLRSIFLYQGIFITSLGAFFGLALGVAIVLLQEHYSLVMLTGTLAYPVSFSFTNIAVVLLTIFPLGILASWIAAGRVSKKFVRMA